MKTVNEAELVQAVPVPSPVPVVPMTRREKLLRWAELIRKSACSMRLMHNLEYRTPGQLAEPAFRVGDQGCMFGIAAGDQLLKEQGFAVSFPGYDNCAPLGSVRDVMNFFELSQPQLHEFSCDCGGAISNDEMASRIEKLAAGGPLGYVRALFSR